MLKSMTGYCKTSHEYSSYIIEIEIRSVNNKYCVVRPKLPQNIGILESRVISKVKSRFVRGSFEVHVSINPKDESELPFVIDINKVGRLIAELDKITKTYRIIDSAISLETIALLKDLYIDKNQEFQDIDALWDGLSKSLDQASDGLDEMRRTEGEYLEKDILFRIGTLDQCIKQIESKTTNNVEEIRARLESKVKNILGGSIPDPDRMNLELVLLAEKSDITEEVTRFKSHIEQTYEIIKNDQAPGHKLEFLMQELLRESNTISSKTANGFVSHKVVDIKVEIDKIREQLLNVE
jgi:uncharacterized protein (TIGR00255 family)